MPNHVEPIQQINDIIKGGFHRRGVRAQYAVYERRVIFTSSGIISPAERRADRCIREVASPTTNIIDVLSLTVVTEPSPQSRI